MPPARRSRPAARASSRAGPWPARRRRGRPWAPAAPPRPRSARRASPQRGLRLVEVREDLVHLALDGGDRLAGLHAVAQVAADRVLEVLVELLVLALERPFDLLEVRDVGLGDLLLRGGGVAVLVGGERRLQRVARLPDLLDGSGGAG